MYEEEEGRSWVERQPLACHGPVASGASATFPTINDNCIEPSRLHQASLPGWRVACGEADRIDGQELLPFSRDDWPDSPRPWHQEFGKVTPQLKSVRPVEQMSFHEKSSEAARIDTSSRPSPGPDQTASPVVRSENIGRVHANQKFLEETIRSGMRRAHGSHSYENTSHVLYGPSAPARPWPQT